MRYSLYIRCLRFIVAVIFFLCILWFLFSYRDFGIPQRIITGKGICALSSSLECLYIVPIHSTILTYLIEGTETSIRIPNSISLLPRTYRLLIPSRSDLECLSTSLSIPLDSLESFSMSFFSKLEKLSGHSKLDSLTQSLNPISQREAVIWRFEGEVEVIPVGIMEVSAYSLPEAPKKPQVRCRLSNEQIIRTENLFIVNEVVIRPTNEILSGHIGYEIKSKFKAQPFSKTVNVKENIWIDVYHNGQEMKVSVYAIEAYLDVCDILNLRMKMNEGTKMRLEGKLKGILEKLGFEPESEIGPLDDWEFGPIPGGMRQETNGLTSMKILSGLYLPTTSDPLRDLLLISKYYIMNSP